jgi:DNA-binding NtrC family response regulator
MESTTGASVYPEAPILVLDGDEALRTRIELLLAHAGLDNVLATGDQALAASLVAERGASLVLLDLFLPAPSGEALLKDFARLAPEIPVIVMTSATDPDTIIRCMRAGALDYVVKPIDEVRLFVSVWNAIATMEMRRIAEVFRDRVLEGRIENPAAFEAIVTRDEHMLALFKYAESVAKSRQCVLITGETGTGKELFARAIHEASGRSGSFIAVNVGGLDDAMFSDSLFGHRKGAFTGADGQRAGLIKEAAGGTILLDEIGDLEPHSQIKLLRLLQGNEYYPLGSDDLAYSDVRVVAATTMDLRAAAAAGSFRSDLFYRLQTHPIAIPPLRARPGDIALLARLFLEKSAKDLGIDFAPEKAEAYAEEIARAVEGYGFPGNVRELESLVHDAVALSRGGALDLDSLRGRIGLVGGTSAPAARDAHVDLVDPVHPIGADGRAAGARAEELPPLARELAEGRIPTLDAAESELIRMAVERASGNLSQAALALGISRQTLYNKLKGPVKS